MINLDQPVEKIKLEIGKTPEADVTRDFLIEIGLREKEGAKRKTLLKWLREEAKAMPAAVPGTFEKAKADSESARPTEFVPFDAPGEPPPGYEPSVEAEPVATVPKPLMQEIDPRPCVFTFQNMDVNLNPVCSIHNSGMCFPCNLEDPPVDRCRVVCFAESPKHRAIKQPKIILKERTIVDNSATVEMVDVSEFDD